MTSKLTQAILIEMIETITATNKTLAQINDVLFEITGDILNAQGHASDSEPEIDEFSEIQYWSHLYDSAVISLRKERQAVKELADRVVQLETELFKTITET